MKTAVLLVLALVLGIASLIVGTDVRSELEELRVSTKPIAVVDARVREARVNIGGFSWSPDGRFFSYKTWWETDSGWAGELMLVDMTYPSDGFENARSLYEEGPPTFGACITWAHDSRRVILNNDRGVLSKSYVIDLESGKRSEILVPENWVIFSESFSPNDSMIVCSAVYFDTSVWHKSQPYFRMVNLDCFRPWRIAVIDLDKNDFRLMPEDTAAGEQFSPGWSADGKTITYCAAKEGFEDRICSCYSLDLATGARNKKYDKGEEFDFAGMSQSGEIQILEKRATRPMHYYGAWALKTDGSGEMWRLTDSLPGKKPAFFYREDFSPDARSVADLYIKEDKTFLRIRELQTGKQKLLNAYKQPIRFPIAWSWDSRSVCYVREDPFYVGKEPRFAFAPRQIVMATIEE